MLDKEGVINHQSDSIDIFERLCCVTAVMRSHFGVGSCIVCSYSIWKKVGRAIFELGSESLFFLLYIYDRMQYSVEVHKPILHYDSFNVCDVESSYGL